MTCPPGMANTAGTYCTQIRLLCRFRRPDCADLGDRGRIHARLGPTKRHRGAGHCHLQSVLVLFFFMHVKYGTKLTKMVVLCGFYWLLLLLGIVMVDILTRNWMGVPGR